MSSLPNSQSTDRAGRGVAPWLAMTVAAFLAVVLVAVLVVQIVHPTKYRISAGDQRAMEAGSQAMVNLTSYTQKTFESDFQRALTGLSGQALTGAQSNHDALIQVMTEAKIDLKGEVTARSIESSSKEGVLVLIYLATYKVLADGSSQRRDSQALELTMKQANGKWLLDNINVLGITQ